jgi:hypothetical protein
VRFFFLISIFSLLCGCAPSLTGAAWEKNPTAAIPAKMPFESFVLILDGDTLEAPSGLQAAYAKELEEALPPQETCRLKIKLQGKVEDRFTSWWYLGAFLPFWPAMPRETDMHMSMEAELFCNDDLVQQINLIEEERTRLFWYGPYRNGEIQASADMMHTKLMQRLRLTLLQNIPVDTGVVPDF